ncbi:hypothetical protein FEDK69T_04010 [Flavobacterium enshiense DK69]|nr:hypothetical protein FEDK69T_04010 [Flavobacterium enshiense DK69]
MCKWGLVYLEEFVSVFVLVLVLLSYLMQSSFKLFGILVNISNKNP